MVISRNNKHRYKIQKKKPSMFPLLPKERCQLCKPEHFSNHISEDCARQISFPFSLEGSLFIKCYTSAGLGWLGSVSCRPLFKSAFASGYCTLIKKAEFIMSTENMSNALCFGKYKSSLLPFIYASKLSLEKKNMWHCKWGIFWRWSMSVGLNEVKSHICGLPIAYFDFL